MPFSGRCHCGKISFDMAGDIPETLTRCTCSFCAKRGALYAYFAPDDVQVSGTDAVYRWGSRQVDYNFCSDCGCAKWSDSPAFHMDGSWDGTTRRTSVNARLIDDFDAADWEVTVIDGKNLW